MQIIIYLLFFCSGLCSFLTYRQGIKDGVKLSNNGEPETLFKKAPEYVQTEGEKDFFNQYNKLMNYDFDKAGENNE